MRGEIGSRICLLNIRPKGCGSSTLSASANNMRTTQRKGDIAKSRAVATFTAKGFDVSLPLTESAPYDLIVDVCGKLIRVQCKYSSKVCVDLRRIHSNSKGYVVKKYATGDFDWLYVLSSDGKEYLIKSSLSGRSTVNLNSENQIGT
jgi:hypothetical protein